MNQFTDPNFIICWALIFTGICLVCSIDLGPHIDRLRDWRREEIGPFADSPRFKR